MSMIAIGKQYNNNQVLLYSFVTKITSSNKFCTFILFNQPTNPVLAEFGPRKIRFSGL